MLYKFKLSHNTAEAAKSICYAKKSDDTVVITLTRWFKKFRLGCKSGSSKTMNFGALCQAIELMSSTQRVSGELSILQFSHFHNFSKSIQSCQIVLHVTKILQNSFFMYVYVYIYICICIINSFYNLSIVSYLSFIGRNIFNFSKYFIFFLFQGRKQTQTKAHTGGPPIGHCLH